MSAHKYTNKLIHETSPYLLQHAHNPVNWQPWSSEAFAEAKEKDLLVIISIGYSACHWCHVMEKESFEDLQVAKLMNENFVCIKIDREELPDIDQLYMNAVQLVNGNGGWPLNVIALPDGRPFWGGTYFPKQSWMSALHQIASLYYKDPDQIEDYATRLTEGVKQVSVFNPQSEELSNINQQLKTGVDNWTDIFDTIYGGNNRSPKFMMPNNLQFLLHYGKIYNNAEVLKQVKLTLDKMAYGGVYDQIGGGFARYSVDKYWKVPHFEKMLYDNGQLLSLYSMAYQEFKNPLYQQIVEQSFDYIQQEMLNSEGLFYSALDADSEGEEGKYYVWTKEELQEIIGSDFSLFEKYYNVNTDGYWEFNNYILLRTQSDEEFALQNKLSVETVRKKAIKWNAALLKVRNKRIKPGLDDKTLSAWNAIMSIGLLDAYATFGDEKYLKLATRNTKSLLKRQMDEKGHLFHTYKNGQAKIDGYLSDYAFVMQLLIRLTELTGDEDWYQQCNVLLQYVNKHFWDEKAGLYTLNSQSKEVLITHQFETFDNVIPAANSVMAHNLFDIGHLAGNTEWMNRSKSMLLKNMGNFGEQYTALSNWGILSMQTIHPYSEIVISAPDSKLLRAQAAQEYLPQSMLCFLENSSEIPLFKDRFQHKQQIYVCENMSCKLPVQEWAEALKLINANTLGD